MHTTDAVASVRAAVALGDLPGWIGAVSTFLGLIAAGFAAWYVRGQLIEMRRQADANGEELARQRVEWAEADRLRARAQAEQIEVMPAKHPADLPGVGSHTYWVLTVRNGSTRPIYGVRFGANVKAADEPMLTMDERVGRIKDTSKGCYFYEDADSRFPLPVLRREDDAAFLVPFLTDLYPHPKFWIQFEDDAGSLWELDSDMHLRPITERWA